MSNNDKPNEISSLVSVDVVAKYLNVRPNTIYKWAREERLPSYKIGETVRFNLEEVKQWVSGTLKNGTKS